MISNIAANIPNMYGNQKSNKIMSIIDITANIQPIIINIIEPVFI